MFHAVATKLSSGECDPASWKNLDYNWLTRSRVFYPFNGNELLVRSALLIGLHTIASGASSANRPTADRGSFVQTTTTIVV